MVDMDNDEEDFKRVENEISEKMQHGFDTRHIYQLFSTFVDKIKNQAERIHDLTESAERSELQLESMNHTIRNMEMNIQGFVTLPSTEDDEALLASRRESRRSSANINESAVGCAPKASTGSRSSSPRMRPNQWQDLPTGSDVASSQPSSARMRKNKRADRAWRYKKRRIIRHVSWKLREESTQDVAAEEDVVEVEENIDVKKSDTPQDVPINEIISEEVSDEVLPKSDTTGAVTKPQEQVNQSESIEASEKDSGPVLTSSQNQENTPSTTDSIEKTANDKIILEAKDEPLKSCDAGEDVANRQDVNLNSTNDKIEDINEMTAQNETTKKPPIAPKSKRLSNEAAASPRRSVNSTPRSSNSGYYDDIEPIDPTQTVVYRISALESTVKEMSEIIQAQKKMIEDQKSMLETQQAALDSAMTNSKSLLHSSQHESDDDSISKFRFFREDSFTEDVTVASVDCNDVEDENVDVEVNFREEEKDHITQQDDVSTKTKESQPIKPALDGKVGSKELDMGVIGDDGHLPAATLNLLSNEVCGSDVMKKLLDRVLKNVERMIDHNIKRIPKPPPQITANDMFTDSVVSALATSMLRRGLLDDLKYHSEDCTPRPTNTDFSSGFALPTASSVDPHEQSNTNTENFQEIKRTNVSREEILEMIRNEIRSDSITQTEVPQPKQFEFTPFVNKQDDNEVVIMPRNQNEMDDEDTIGSAQKEDEKVEDPHSPQSSVREATMGERAKTVLEQQVQVMEHDKVSVTQLNDLARNMSNYITVEVGKVATHYEGIVQQLSTSFQSRQDANDKKIMNLRHALNDLEQSMNNQFQHAHKSSKKKDDEPWKSDLLKVSQSVNKAREDQRTVAKMMVEELENLQNQLKERVDESRLEHMARSIEDNVQKELGENVSGINLSMAKIISAVRNKTDRNETEALIRNRLREAEEYLLALQDEEPAGAFKCISCGVSGKKMTPPTSLESQSFASVIMSQSAEVKRNRGGDHDQAAAVLNRQAGLRPLSRQQKPMTPKTFTPTSAPTKEMTLEPLYRRAKHANKIREIPKIPNITFGVGNQNQYKLDERPNSPYFPTLGGSQSAPTTQNGSFSGAL